MERLDLYGKARRELQRLVRNHRFEEMPNGGIWVPGYGAVGGSFFHSVNNGDVVHEANEIVTQGKNFILDLIAGNKTVAAWYIGIYTGAAALTLTGQNVATSSGETTAYSQATRPVWQEAGASGASITNAASKAQFSMTGTVTVTGAFLVTFNTKGSNGSGTDNCLAAKDFDTARDLVSGDNMDVGYTLTIDNAA